MIYIGTVNEEQHLYYHDKNVYVVYNDSIYLVNRHGSIINRDTGLTVPIIPEILNYLVLKRDILWNEFIENHLFIQSLNRLIKINDFHKR